MERRAEVKRVTNETDIEVRLNLDGTGNANIHTGLGFLDHMLQHIAVHGMFDLEVLAQGDLEIDPHHTLEDCAIVLGDAFDQALGKRGGIKRMGHAYVPMDEALVFVAIDLSGRSYSVFHGDWHTPYVGTIPCSLFQHFLESFATAARCNLHARVLYGRDDHHQAEGLFKALGRALDSAAQLDARRQGRVPSTKGTLNE
jgi:imidazoleglycerol-phosphate dehydratase